MLFSLHTAWDVWHDKESAARTLRAFYFILKRGIVLTKSYRVFK